jgi:iron complex outermembrane receptor protein
MQKKYLLGSLGLLLHLSSVAQVAETIEGTVQNNRGVLLPGALVTVKDTYVVDGTDEKGHFRLSGNFSQRVVLVVSYVGYETQEVTYNSTRSAVPITLLPSHELSEVVVAASRVEENLGQAPVTIDKLNQRQIENLTTPDLVAGLARVRGVDVSSSSMLNGSFTTRGFNSTGGERVIQLTDYFPTLSPGLSTNFGNLGGAPVLDIASVEIVHGASSALYGANAFNGVLLLNTKNPFLDQGLSVRLRGGNRNLLDGQFRYAVKLSERVAFKITGGAIRANDFVADNQNATSRVIEPNNNPVGSNLGYDAVSRYGDISNTFVAGPLAGKTVFLPGYAEGDLLQEDARTKSYKVTPTLSVLLTNSIKATAFYSYTHFTGIYQNGTRYAQKNSGQNLGGLTVEGSNWVVRGSLAKEFSGTHDPQGDGPYNLGLLGSYLQTQPIAGAGISPTTGRTYTYAERYFGTYAGAYETAVQAGSTPDAAALVARNFANTNAPLLQPGTDAFTIARNQLTHSTTPGNGARLLSRSLLANANAQYHFQSKIVDAVVGGDYRQYILDSDGTLFTDERGGDHLHNYEYGGYAQVSKSFLDNRVKLAAAGRADHFKNFGTAVSPRASVVYSAGEDRQHNFRASYSRAFRSPTQADQYVRLDVGRTILLGNIGNGYRGYATPVAAQLPGILYPGQEAELAKYEINIDKLKLEQVNTFEVGYRAALLDNLSLDAEYYYNLYSNFIGGQGFIGNTDGSRPTPEQLGASATAQFQNTLLPTRIILVSSNVDQRVRSHGAGLALTYNVLPTLTLTGNYSYSELLTHDFQEGTFSFFNTPKNKFNLGADTRLLDKRLSVNVNYRWNSSYLYESTFATGTLPVGQTFDAQVGYTVPKLYTTLQVGGTNIFDTNNLQAYGAANYSRLVYVGLLFNLSK